MSNMFDHPVKASHKALSNVKRLASSRYTSFPASTPTALKAVNVLYMA